MTTENNYRAGGSMRILAIESSAVTASVAILEDDTLVAEYTINHKMTHSQTLLPMIDEIFSMVQLKPDDVDVIAVSKGPGSFTGLRIGAATGKGIALALDKRWWQYRHLRLWHIIYMETADIYAL